MLSTKSLTLGAILAGALPAQSQSTTRATIDATDVVRVLVVDAAGAPQEGAEVLYWSRNEVNDKSVAERMVVMRADLELTLRAYGTVTTTEADGVALLPRKLSLPFGFDVCARKGELWAQETLWTGQVAMRLVVARDRSLTVRVRDARSRPAGGVEVWLFRAKDDAASDELEYLPVGVTDASGDRIVPHVQHYVNGKKLWATLRVPGLPPPLLKIDTRDLPATPLEFHLPPLGSVVVSLRGGDDKPLRQPAQVHLGLLTKAQDMKTRWNQDAHAKTTAQDPSRAVLCVTHDHRILGYADRIIRIEDGRIVADERPKDKVAAGQAADALALAA